MARVAGVARVAFCHHVLVEIFFQKTSFFNVDIQMRKNYSMGTLIAQEYLNIQASAHISVCFCKEMKNIPSGPLQ